jgi:hypothetical protein
LLVGGRELDLLSVEGGVGHAQWCGGQRLCGSQRLEAQERQALGPALQAEVSDGEPLS